MRHIATCGLPGSKILFHIITYTDFEKIKILNTECVFQVSLQLLRVSETFSILRRNDRDITKDVNLSSWQVSVIPVRVSRNLNFLNRFPNNTHIKLQVSRPSGGAELFHAERRPVRYEEFLISNFRRVLNVVCFFLGYSPASEFYMPTFRNTLFRLHRRLGV